MKADKSLCDASVIKHPQGVYHTLRNKSPYLELFWSTFFPHFPAFRMNTERSGVPLLIQSECGKMQEKFGPE